MRIKKSSTPEIASREYIDGTFEVRMLHEMELCYLEPKWMHEVTQAQEMRPFHVQMPMRGVKMAVLKLGRSCGMCFWQLTEYFTPASSIPKLFLRWRMHTFCFCKWKWHDFLAICSSFRNGIHHSQRSVELTCITLHHCLHVVCTTC